MIALEDQ